MLFCVKTPINKLYVFGLALLLAATLAGCGGGGGGTGGGGGVTQPTPSTADEQFAARLASENARIAKEAAMAAVPGAVTAATAAAGKAATYAANAAGSATMAMNARTDYDKTKMASDAAAAENAKAMAAKTAADGAETALSDAVAAYNAAVKDQDIETKAGATAIKTAADALEAAAMKAQTDAAQAQMDAEAARDMAMDDADDAAMYAATHVLGLFEAANAEGVEDADARKAAVAAVATAIGTAAANQGAVGVSALWPADTTDDDDNVVAGVLMVTITGVGGNITSDTMGTDGNNDGDTEDAGEGPNASVITGQTGFSHGFDISAHPSDSNDPDGRHVIVFTDKKQGTPAVTAVTAVPAKTLTNADTSVGAVTDLGAMSGNSYTGVTYYEDSNSTSDSGLAFTGTLTCPLGISCSTTISGDTITVTGYTFSGSRPARKAVDAADAAENNDYLAFGVWLNEDSDTGTAGDQPALGAFAGGGANFSTPNTLEGKATYNGAATGVYTQGSKVDYFEGAATLTADFGANDEAGIITGMIKNIVAGGMAMSGDVIYLNDDATPDDGNINSDGTFSGNARMGTGTTVDSVTTYPYNGAWSGRFHGPAAADDATGVDTLPPAAAGTFGVTGTTGTGDDAVTTSYVGAFGARR